MSSRFQDRLSVPASKGPQEGTNVLPTPGGSPSSLAMWWEACGILALDWGWNLCPLQGKHRVLTSGSPGKSLNINFLQNMYVANIIFQFVACHFILMTFPFSEKFLKILVKFKLSLLSFIDPAFGIISKNLPACSMSSRFSLIL